MAQPFFQRLKEYYLDVAKVLRGEANVASIFPNTSDIGSSRENIYAEFLKLHAPSKCSVFLGGFLFDDFGVESRQLDVIVITDTVPRFNFFNSSGSGKSFAHVEGALGVVSIKSSLNKADLENALEGLASIPSTNPLGNRIPFNLQFEGYEDWPYKVVYATDGLSIETILEHINNFYLANPLIPITRRPNLIHVCGKYFIVRAAKGMTTGDPNAGTSLGLIEGSFYPFTHNVDLQAIVRTIEGLQKNAQISTHILYNYDAIINGLNRT